MSATYFDRPPLIGEAVVIRRRVPADPVNREGWEGTVIDVANRGLEFRIRFGDGTARWYDLNNLAKPAPRPVPDADLDADQAHVDAIEASIRYQTPREGGAWEPPLAFVRTTFDTELAIAKLRRQGDYRMHVVGVIGVTRAVAFVPSVRS
jgi:hypothetical protein